MVTERVWIIGASSGIGAALAERLAGDGKEVWASARSVGKLEALAGKHPGYIHALPLDVTDKAAVQAALARIESPAARRTRSCSMPARTSPSPPRISPRTA